MDKFEYDSRSGERETKSGESWTKGEWWTEAQDVALTGSPAYCQRFFAELFNEFPVLAPHVVFSRWSVQPDWIYASFNGFTRDLGVQIYGDEGQELIVVWGPNGGGEYGYWEEDLVASALTYIREIMSLFER